MPPGLVEGGRVSSNRQQGLKAAGEGGNLTPQAQRTEAPRELLRHRGPGSPRPTLQLLNSVC